MLEVETQAQIAERLTYIDKATALRLLAATSEVGHLLNGLSRALSSKQSTITDQLHSHIPLEPGDSLYVLLWGLEAHAHRVYAYVGGS